MKINPIQSNFNQTKAKQPNFKQLRLNDRGALKLAYDFKNNPGLKEKFITKILNPLKACKVDVVFDGHKSFFREPKDDYYKSVLMVFDNEYRVVPVTGPFAYCREIFRPYSKNVPYTNEFHENQALRELEAAKNMALYMQNEEGIEHQLAPVKLVEIPDNHPLKAEIKEIEELCK